VIVVLAVFGAVAAFATIAPSPDAQLLLSPTSTVEALPIPAEGLLPSPASYIREERFQRGDTLSAFLLRLGVAEGEAAPLARQRALQALRPGYNVAANVSAEGRLVALSFLTARDTLVQISREGEEFRSSEERAALYTQVAMKSSVVQSSLFAASDTAGIPTASPCSSPTSSAATSISTATCARATSSPWSTSCITSPGGRCGRDACSRPNFPAGARRFARFTTATGTTRRRQQPAQGVPARTARVLARELGLRPARASHRQGLARAPGHRLRGTDRNACARGGSRGRRARGTARRLRQHGHPAPSGQYSTVYAHLSRIAVKRGARVDQNDTIGFVGQTGWATGPHLHYEFRVNGQSRNPMSIAMPAASPVPAAELAAFQAHAAPLIAPPRASRQQQPSAAGVAWRAAPR
jgi:hypothetical protein